MCYTRRKIEGGVFTLRECDDTNFLKPNGQSRNLNIYCLPPEDLYSHSTEQTECIIFYVILWAETPDQNITPNT